jgi:hypothetical protein
MTPYATPHPAPVTKWCAAYPPGSVALFTYYDEPPCEVTIVAYVDNLAGRECVVARGASAGRAGESSLVYRGETLAVITTAFLTPLPI